MSEYRSVKVICDRCDNELVSEPSDMPRAAQRAGWLTLDWRDYRTGADHDSARTRDICSKCSDEFREFL